MEDYSHRFVTISCPNHHAVLVNTLWNYFTSQYSVDFDFRWKGRMIKAHQLIADVFLSPLRLCLMELDQSETGCHYNWGYGLDSLFEFMYTGQVTIQEDQISCLLEIAKELDFQMLVEAIEMLKNSDDAGLVSPKKPRKENVWTELGGNEYQKTLEQQKRSEVYKKLKGCKIQTLESVSVDPSFDSFSSDLETVRDPQESGHLDANNSVCGFENAETPDVIQTKAIGQNRTSIRRKSTRDKQEESEVRGNNIKRKTNTNIYKCNLCPYETAGRTLFQVHLAKKHDPSIKVFTCPSCRKAFVSEDTLKRHRCRTRPPPTVLQCPHCEFKGTNRWWYTAHVARHDPSIPVFKCDLCCRKYLSQEALDRHVGSHITYKCPRCDFQVLKKWSYLRHLFKQHGVNTKGQPVTMISCPNCEFICKTDAQLNIHSVAKHSNYKPFKCDYPKCSFSSGYKADVKKHVRVTHLGIKPCMCELCGFCTVSQSKLEKHQRSHQPRPKPYSCAVCRETFEEIGQLEKHALVHNEKPFGCHACGNGFSRREYLKAHLKNVHQIKMSLDLFKSGILQAL